MKHDCDVRFDTKIVIRDANTREIIREGKNAIHPQNMSRVIARALANEPNSVIHRIAFGNGGTYIDAVGNVVFNTPNDGVSGGWEARLYNETYSEVVDELHPDFKTDPGSADVNNVRMAGGASPSDDPDGGGVVSVEVGRKSNIVLTVVINENEPTGQVQTQNLGPVVDTDEIYFQFDEIGLFTSGKPAKSTHGYSTVNVGADKLSTSNTTLTPNTDYNLPLVVDGATYLAVIRTPASGTGVSGSFTYGDICEGINTGEWIASGDNIDGLVYTYITDRSGGAYPSIIGVQSYGFLTFESLSTGDFSSVVLECATGDGSNLFNVLTNGVCANTNSNNKFGVTAGVANDALHPENERERLLTHFIFDPILKSRDRAIEIEYTLTVSIGRSTDSQTTLVVPSPTPTPTPTSVEVLAGCSVGAANYDVSVSDGLTRLDDGWSNDQGDFEVLIPFDVMFNGVNYGNGANGGIRIHTDSCVMFGGDWYNDVQNGFANLDPANGIFVSSYDLVVGSIFGGLDPNNSNVYKLKYTGFDYDDIQTPLVWEMTFFKDCNHIQLIMHTDSTGINAIGDGVNPNMEMPSLQGGRTYALASDATGSNWTVSEGSVTYDNYTNPLYSAAPEPSHRWDFAETLNDSIGTAHGTITSTVASDTYLNQLGGALGRRALNVSVANVTSTIIDWQSRNRGLTIPTLNYQSTPHTVVAWVFNTSNSTIATRVSGMHVTPLTSSIGSFYGIIEDRPNNTASYFVGDSTGPVDRSKVYKWYMLTMTYDGNNAKLMVNNEVIHDGPITVTDVTKLSYDRIGQRNGEFSDTYYDFVEIYDSVLSESDITGLYNKTKDFYNPIVVEFEGDEF